VESPLVYIIVLAWNGREDTAECLRSLRKVAYANVRILVVDNASCDGTADMVRTGFPEAELIVNPENLRFAGGNNVGIRHALERGAAYVVLLNNDTVVDPAFLSSLVALSEADPGVGMAVPKIYFFSEPKRIWYAGGKISWWKGQISHVGVHALDDGRYDAVTETDYATGCCVLVRRSLVEQVGMLDEAYFIYGEDADWSMRARRSGWKIVYAPQAMVWHKVSVSSGGHLSWFKNWNKLRSNVRLMARYATWYEWLTLPFAFAGRSIFQALRSVFR
jgi:GT2 family glycosyltransferase